MTDVFISYARSSERPARQIAEALGDAGYDVWIDSNLPAHRSYSEEIEERLNAASAVVVLWSEEAAKSQWVRAEADLARQAGKIVQAVLDQGLPPIPFNQIQCADFQGWEGDRTSPGWIKLLGSVAALAGSREPSSAHARINGAQRSVCVLPFANMSGDAEQEYFSDGISEDITTDLSKVSALAVTARNTAFQFKGKSVDVRAIAQRLGVSHVLEGSVRKSGGRVRITAQLIDGLSGDHIWAERYDRELTDIFALQDEISKAIVDALKIKLLPEEKKAIEQRGTTSAEAYDLYLLARQYWVTGNDGDVRRDEIILRLCRSALEIDPDYARAWALMALTQSSMHRRNVAVEETGMAAAQKALELDPGLAEPHCVIADNFAMQGRFGEADAESAVALNIDPESWEVNKEAALVSYRQGRTKEAMERFDKAASLMENDYRSSGLVLSCARALGDLDATRRAAQMTVARVEHIIAQDRSNAAALAYGATGLAALGEVERATDWMRRAMLVDPDNVIMRYNLACLAAKDLEDPEMALELVGRFMAQANAYQIKHVENDPDLVTFRQDARFQAMIADAKERLASGKYDPN